MAVTLFHYIRHYLSESGEKEALHVLREQLQHQKCITSDDVRLAVRAVASQGGAVSIPPDFPPSRWVLEFKRMHGFVQLHCFAFDAAAAAAAIAGGKKPCRALEQMEMAPLRPVPVTSEAGSKSERSMSVISNNNCSNSNNSISMDGKRSSTMSTSVTHITGKDNNGSSDDKKDKRASKDTSHSLLPMLFKAAVAYADPCSQATNEAQRQEHLQHSFSQRHRQQLQQQQRRAMIVGERRRTGAWPRESAAVLKEKYQETRRGSWNNETRANIGLDTRSSGSSSDDGPNGGRELNAMLPQIQQVVISNGSSMDEYQDSVSNASSSNDKRGYKMSHTVPAETWEKAIAAVEQQGMSLRTAAKMYGVHFAALHRRVKKRTQGGQENGNDGYFHPNDEAKITRVVVVRAELGVLMTFDELMRLVEAVALRKLPDISVDSARKLLTRFESRNAQSIRHIIEDWPPPQACIDAYSSAGEGIPRQSQPYLEHPGFVSGPESLVFTRPAFAGTASDHGHVATDAGAAADSTLCVPSSRSSSPLISIHDDAKMSGTQGLSNNNNSSNTQLSTSNSEPSNDQVITVSSTSSNEDNESVMVI